MIRDSFQYSVSRLKSDIFTRKEDCFINIYELTENLSRDKFTEDSLKHETSELIKAIYLVVTSRSMVDLNTFESSVKHIVSKQNDVERYKEKWTSRAEKYKNTIKYLQTDEFVNLVMPSSSVPPRQLVYKEYLPVIQTLYREREICLSKSSVAADWLHAVGLIANVKENWGSEDEAN